MSWFVYSFLGAFSMSVYMVLCRALLRDKGDGLAFTFITTFFGGLALVLLFPLEKVTLPQNLNLFWVLIPLALFFGLIDFLFVRGRQLEEVANVSVAIQSGHFWNVLGSVLIFGELLTGWKLIGIFLIAVANLLILWQGRRINLSAGIKMILVGTFLWVIAVYFDKTLSLNFSGLFYKATLFLIEATGLFVILGHKRWWRSLNEWKLQGWPIIIVGPFLALANFFYVRAFQVGGEASRVLPIFSLSLILATIGGIIFLNERESLVKKILAAVGAFAGAYLIQSVAIGA